LEVSKRFYSQSGESIDASDLTTGQLVLFSSFPIVALLSCVVVYKAINAMRTRADTITGDDQADWQYAIDAYNHESEIEGLDLDKLTKFHERLEAEARRNDLLSEVQARDASRDATAATALTNDSRPTPESGGATGHTGVGTARSLNNPLSNAPAVNAIPASTMASPSSPVLQEPRRARGARQAAPATLPRGVTGNLTGANARATTVGGVRLPPKGRLMEKEAQAQFMTQSRQEAQAQSTPRAQSRQEAEAQSASKAQNRQSCSYRLTMVTSGVAQREVVDLEAHIREASIIKKYKEKSKKKRYRLGEGIALLKDIARLCKHGPVQPRSTVIHGAEKPTGLRMTASGQQMAPRSARSSSSLDSTPPSSARTGMLEPNSPRASASGASPRGASPRPSNKLSPGSGRQGHWSPRVPDEHVDGDGRIVPRTSCADLPQHDGVHEEARELETSVKNFFDFEGIDEFTAEWNDVLPYHAWRSRYANTEPSEFMTWKPLDSKAGNVVKVTRALNVDYEERASTETVTTEFSAPVRVGVLPFAESGIGIDTVGGEGLVSVRDGECDGVVARSPEAQSILDMSATENPDLEEGAVSSRSRMHQTVRFGDADQQDATAVLPEASLSASSASASSSSSNFSSSGGTDDHSDAGSTSGIAANAGEFAEATVGSGYDSHAVADAVERARRMSMYQDALCMEKSTQAKAERGIAQKLAEVDGNDRSYEPDHATWSCGACSSHRT